MYLKPKTDKPILWSSVEKILGDAFAVIILNLQQKYATDGDALLYFAIDQNSLVNGLRSSVHVLKENSIRSMVQNVMSTFNSFLNSNQNIELNSTFEVYFKVVSGLHVNVAGHRRKAIPLRATVGHRGAQNGCYLHGGLLNLPTGYLDDPNFFENQCLLLCLVFQFIYITQPFMVCYLDAFLKKKNCNKKQYAGEMLNTYIEEFCHKAQIDRTGPHDLHTTSKLFSEIYKCQVISISSLDGFKPQFVMFPPTLNFEMPRIYLYIKDNHVLLIKNLETFWRKERRKICFGCKNVYGYWPSNFSYHKCQQLHSCTLCFAILKSDKTIVIPNESIPFCDSLIVTNNAVSCDRCSNKFKSYDCFTNHLGPCKKNRLGTKCDNCNVMVPQDCRLLHSCGVELKRCRLCFNVTTPDHECLIQKQTETKTWPIIGTLMVTFKSTMSSDCQKCYEVKLNRAAELNILYSDFCKHKSFLSVTCDKHALNPFEHSKTNAISLWKERNRFSFELVTFLDDTLEQTFLDQTNADAYLKHRLYTYCSDSKPYTDQPGAIKKSKRISTKIEALKNVTFESAEKKFFQYIIKGNLQNCTILTDSDKVMQKLLEIFLSFEVQPYVSQKGKQIFCLEIAQFSVKFLNFAHYAPGTLGLWQKQYNVVNEQCYFPEILNTDQNLAISDKIVIKFEDFICFGDSTDELCAKRFYFDNLQQPLDLKKFLLDALFEKSNNFFRVVMEFLRESFSFQRKLSNIFKKEIISPIHPFAGNIVSCSGLVHALCQYYSLNEFNICTVQKPFGVNPAQVSHGEYEYTSYLAFENPHLNIQTAFNHSDGQKIFGNTTADAYSNVNKTIYAYFGCFHHSHDPNVCLNKNAKKSALKDKNPLLAEEKRILDVKLLEKTVEKFANQVNGYKIMWECEWALFKKNNPLMIKQFWNKTGLPQERQLIRLVPRAAVRGGFLETYKLKCFADDQNKISWIDANSLYSHIAMQCLLPLGAYKTLTFSELKNQCVLDPKDGMFYLNGQSMECDIAMVEILCPPNLKKPFLSYRVKDEFVFLANCKKCADSKLTDPCKHSNKARAFTSTWTVVELAYAVHHLGYEIVNWLELHHYEDSGFLLKKFVQALASQKLQCSGILSKCTSESEKIILCDQVNRDMDFKDPDLLLTPSNCLHNTALQSYLKTCLNSLYGRFSINNHNTKHEFCRSIHEIEKFTSDANINILDFVTINDNIVEIVIEQVKKKFFGNRNSNMYFTALINARGRIFIYDLANQLETIGCDILSIDTDSICFKHPKNLNLPVKFSPAFGHFKHCLDERFDIKAYYSLGVRSYLILYNDENGCEKYLTKIKGLSLGSHNVMEKITPDLFQNFIDSHFKKEVESIYIPQCRSQLNKQTKTFRQIMSTHEFTNEIHCRRFIIPSDQTFTTYPYGYNFTNI